MNPHDYFIKFLTPSQKRYEALKAFYSEKLSATDAAVKFGFTPAYFKKLRFEFTQQLRVGVDPFFSIAKTGQQMTKS